MAGKNYEVIFQFRAALDSSMGQIRSVSDDLEELRQRHAALQETLAEAENLQAYRKNVEDAAAKVQELKEREQAATQTLENATAARKTAEETVKRHELRIVELKAAVRDENAAYDSNITLLKEAKASEAEIQEEKLRHKAAIESLKNEIGQEEIALKKSQQAKADAIRTEKEAEAAKKNATLATKDAEKALEQEKAKLLESVEALKRAGINTEELEKAIEQLNAAIRENSEELEKAEEKQRAYEAALQRMKDVTDVLRSIRMVTDAIADMAEPVLDLMQDSLQSAADLEKRISSVKAISGASAEEVKILTRQIRETGATTVFTAEEAADAMETMALAGWDAQQMIAGLPGVVNLAAAAGEDLASMTSIVADGMNAFQLSGERAAVKFADVLAKAATSSNTNVALIGESLSYVETTAGNLGYSIEDVALALSAMANNALKGSVAGSSLNTTLTRMSGANSTAAKQMEAMGLSMYDATGEAKPLAQFLEELRDAFKGFGDDAQSAQIAAYRLAGQRGMRGLLAIVNANDEQWKALKEDIYNFQGAAEQISTERLDNYSGKVQLLSDAFTDLKISMGNQLLPLATEGVEVLTDLTGKANDLVQTSPGLAVWATGAAGAIVGVSKAVNLASSAAQGLYFIMKMLPAGVSLGSVLGGVGAATAGLAALSGLVLLALDQDRKSAGYQNNKFAKENYKSLEELYAGTAEMRSSMEKLAGQAITPQEISVAAATIDNSYKEEIEEYQNRLVEALEARKEFVDRINSEAPGVLKLNAETGRYEFATDYLDIGAGLESPAYSLSKRDAETLETLNNTVVELTDKHHELNREREEYRLIMEQTYQRETELQSISLDRYIEIEEALAGVEEAWAKVWEETYTAYSSVFSLFEKVEKQEANLDEMLKGLESQSAYWESYINNLNTLRTAANDAGIDLGTLWDELASSGDAQSAAYIQEIVNSLGDLENPDTTKLEELVSLYERVASLREAAADVYASEDDEVLAALDALDAQMREAIEESGSYSEAKKAIRLTIDGYIDGIEEEGDEVIRSLERLGSRIKTAVGSWVYSSGKKKTIAESVSGMVGITDAYAKGTDSARPGVALVGEEGPELLLMQGGEKVITARETEKLMLAAHAATHGATVNAYAKGIDSAPPGVALVGEEGPELLAGRDGESIINTAGMWKLFMLTKTEQRQRPAAAPLRLIQPKEQERRGREEITVQQPAGGSRNRETQSGAPIFTANVTIMGNANREDVTEALEISERRFEEWWERMERTRARTAY